MQSSVKSCDKKSVFSPIFVCGCTFAVTNKTGSPKVFHDYVLRQFLLFISMIISKDLTKRTDIFLDILMCAKF